MRQFKPSIVAAICLLGLSENNREPGRTQRLKKVRVTAGEILPLGSGHSELTLSVELGTRQSARFAGQSCVASKVLSRLWRSLA